MIAELGLLALWLAAGLSGFQLFAAIEKVDLSNSLGDHLNLVAAIETGDKTVALDAFIEHIQDGFDLQMEAVG